MCHSFENLYDFSLKQIYGVFIYLCIHKYVRKTEEKGNHESSSSKQCSVKSQKSFCGTIILIQRNFHTGANMFVQFPQLENQLIAFKRLEEATDKTPLAREGE